MTTLALLLLFATTLLNGQHSLVAGEVDDIQYGITKCVQVPSLHCKNGSSCTPGIASFGKQHDHLDLQTHESNYHCRCKSGFIGHECETEVDECDGDAGKLQSCYHGSKCQSSGNNAYCDCDELNANSGDTDTKFGGAMCQHESTSFCAVSLVGTQSPNHQFCTNHGKCIKMVLGGELHPGCDCTVGWMGDHCAIRQDPFFQVNSLDDIDGGSTGSASMIMLSLLVVASVFVMLCVAFMFLNARAKRNASDSLEAIFQYGGDRSAEKKANVFQGDLEADGSGTLGSPSKDGSSASDDDLVEERLDDSEYVPKTEIV